MLAPAGHAFVGRTDELERLERAICAAQNGAGRTALITGEAGIGKTRLAAEVSHRAGRSGFTVLTGRAFDLVGTELPFQPIADALRPLGTTLAGQECDGSSRATVFGETLSRITERAASAPVLLVIEDVHWADTSTLDLITYLAHNISDRSALLAVTLRDDPTLPAPRLRRFFEAVRRADSTEVLELGPIADADLSSLLIARVGASPIRSRVEMIVDRSRGNPYFAEELLAAAVDGRDELPGSLRDGLLERIASLDSSTNDVLRAVAAAGGDIAAAVLVGVCDLAEPALRTAVRAAVDHGVLVVDQGAGRYRFRHPLLAEAVSSTVLPGERELLHGRLADEMQDHGAAGAVLAPHWAIAGRRREALVASVRAATESESLHGVAEAHLHLERAISLWDAVPDAAEAAGTDLAALCTRAAELASQVGESPRAVELVRRAIDVLDDRDPVRTSLLHQHLGRYLFESGEGDTFLTAFEHAVDLVAHEPPSSERAWAHAKLANGLQLVWRYDESISMCERALQEAGAVGDADAELATCITLGIGLTYTGRAEDGLQCLHDALRSAELLDDHLTIYHAHVAVTDALMMVGRPRDAAAHARVAMESLRSSDIDVTVLAANRVEALIAIGDWNDAEVASMQAMRATAWNYPHMTLMNQADLEIGRGRFDAARDLLHSARPTVRHAPGVAVHEGYLATLAVWERRWLDAVVAIDTALRASAIPGCAQIRVWLCAIGLRAAADLASVADARRDADASRRWRRRARSFVATADEAAASAADVTPNVAGWLALARGEHRRAQGEADPRPWRSAARAWEQLDRPPIVAYCRWREAEALLALGARREALPPLRKAHAEAVRLGASPLLDELEALARRGRLDISPATRRRAEDRSGELRNMVGLTTREVQVLQLLALGYTNGQIADSLVINIKTASVHVSHILRKLEVSNRHEAAAIACRLDISTPA